MSNPTRKRSPAAIGFLLPNFLGFCLFTLFPVVLSFGMSFTNWSLKPAIPLEFLGLRNFVDLLGVQSTGVGAPGVCAVYVFCVVLLLTGLGTALWALPMGWRGLRASGWTFVALGVVTAVLAASHGATHGFYIVAGLAMVFGWIEIRCAAEDDRSALGRAGWPALAVALAAGGLFILHRPMWAAYEPRDPRFWQYLYNTLYFLLALPVAVAGSLGLALLLNNGLPIERRQQRVGIVVCVVGAVAAGAALWALGWRDAAVLSVTLWLIAAAGLAFNVVAFRTIFYLPSFTSGVALMILWKALYNPQTGPINVVLAAVTGLPKAGLPQWLASIALAKPALMIMGVWTGIGGIGMLLYLAALSNVPPDLLEAASIDGASAWQRFAHILWSQVLPTTFFIGITSVIGGLQGGFEQARVMTAGGPAGATTTLSYYIYTLGFEDLNFGYAAALSWVLFAVLFVLTLLNWRFGKNLDV